MKAFITSFRKQGAIYPFLLLTFFAISSLSSCKSDNSDNGPFLASIMIVNSAEGSAAQDLYLDGTKVNSQAVAYTQSSGYVDVISGTRTAEFKASGSATVNSSSSINFQKGKYYTIYYTGGTASSANYSTEDDRSAPSSGKVKVRFVNLSTAANSSLDIVISGGAKVVSALAYKTASAYAEFDPSVTTSFQATAAGNSSGLLTLGSLGFQAGHNYTIVVSGTTTTNLTYKVLANN